MAFPSLAERIVYHEAGHAVAALAFGVPIIRVIVDSAAPAMHRGRYKPPTADIGVEVMATLCLAGPASEQLFCGEIIDGSDTTDIEMARGYLMDHYNAVRLGAALARHRDAAEKQVRTPWARHRIELIASALLRRGCLNGDEIGELVSG